MIWKWAYRFDKNSLGEMYAYIRSLGEASFYLEQNFLFEFDTKP